MLENALKYVTRKKKRSLIIFIILTIVLSCLYSCLNIMKSSKNLENSLYKSSNSQLVLTRKDNGFFEIEKTQKINDIKEISESIYQYFTLAKPKDAKVVEGQQKVERDDLADEFKNIVSVEATNTTKKNVLFTSGVFNIKEGRHLEKTDKNKILIHEDFAKKNNLKLNDKVKLEFLGPVENNQNKDYEFEIVGIFSGKKQEMYTGLSSDFSENMVFLDYESSQLALNNKTRLINKLSLFSDNPENMKKAFDEIKALDINWSEYNLEKDTKVFEETLDSLSAIGHIINIMTISIMIAGVVVLSLILMLWLRERIYEIGILLSIGFNKKKL